MMTIQGIWFDGNTSAQIDAVLKVYGNGAWQLVRADNGQLLSKHSKFSPKVSPRLGDTPRYLTFSNGGSFETGDNQGVDEILAALGQSNWLSWVHMLESKMRYVLPALVVSILLSVAAVKYGVPAVANMIAARLPKVVYQKAGEEALKFLDRYIFKTSQLEPAVEQRLRDHLQGTLDAYPEWPLVVRFRKGGPVGPNAFALPDGQIIFTDEMVKIAENDDEILAVLAHEIGHVVHRHGMRRMVQDSLLTFAILAVTGDASGVSEIFLGLPVVLTELSYSRAFERDADQFALNHLLSHGIAPRHFASILMRIGEIDASEKERSGKKWSNYLSTHPPTQERVTAFIDNAQESRPAAPKMEK